MGTRLKKFDFDAALSVSEATTPIIGSHATELAHPLIHEWVRKCWERQKAGRLSWATARQVLQRACAENGLPPLRSDVQVIAHYARRKFRE